MVQFLTINFYFLDFFNFCWGFQKFPFFVSPCIRFIPYITHTSPILNFVVKAIRLNLTYWLVIEGPPCSQHPLGLY